VDQNFVVICCIGFLSSLETRLKQGASIKQSYLKLARSKLSVISGIGKNTDFGLSDPDANLKNWQHGIPYKFPLLSRKINKFWGSDNNF
jgi:hypothetical protein